MIEFVAGDAAAAACELDDGRSTIPSSLRTVMTAMPSEISGEPPW
jgi:hypothetical protein